MTFFKDLSFNIYPVSSITRMVFQAPPEGNPNAGFYLVDLKGDNHCRVSCETAQNLLRHSWRFVTAPVGTTLLELKEDIGNSNDPFHRTSVLALAIDDEGALMPVTAEGISEVQDWGILTPDGLVSDKFGSSFVNATEFLENRQRDEDDYA